MWIDNPEDFKPHLKHERLLGLRAADPFRRKIPERLAEAGCVLVFWSTLSVQSDAVCSEAKRALSMGKLIPIRINGVSLPLGFDELKTLKLVDVTDLTSSSQFAAIVSEIKRRLHEHSRITSRGYDGLFSPAGYQIAFAPYLNPDGRILRRFKINAVSTVRRDEPYELPTSFKKTEIRQPGKDAPCCRLLAWPVNDTALQFVFSEVKYSDYLKSNEHLDDRMPGHRLKTFRNEFADRLPELDATKKLSLRGFDLSNICGVGLFVQTSDEKVLICRHSEISHVYPLRWTFSASGVMRWGAWPNPFHEIIWRCRREIGHQIDPNNLELIEFGVDARKLFFEYCFCEKTQLTGRELLIEMNESCEDPQLPIHAMIPLEPLDDFVNCILVNCWEPAAEAVLLMIAIEKYGPSAVRQSLTEAEVGCVHHQMLDEWDMRASRSGILADMSTRYPQKFLKRESQKDMSIR